MVKIKRREDRGRETLMKRAMLLMYTYLELSVQCTSFGLLNNKNDRERR